MRWRLGSWSPNTGVEEVSSVCIRNKTVYHLDGVWPCGLSVLDDEVEVLVLLCKSERLRADATTDIHDQRALGK